jgi:hypothetical protein
MKWYIAFGVVLLLLVGCGQKTVYICADETQVDIAADCTHTEEIADTEPIQQEINESVEEVLERIVENTEGQSYILSDSEKALLAERFSPSVRAVLSTPLVKDLHAGSVYVVGLGLRNILGSYSRDFVVDIKFREAKDFSGSVLETDDELIQAWLGKNLFTTYSLQRNEEIILPIIIEIGDKLTEKGDPVVPGTYIYDVYVGYITNAESTDEYQNLIMTVQVTE